MERVVAVVVTYKPDPELFGRMLAALRPQVVSTVVIDNDDRTRFVPEAPDIRFLSLGDNYGIAKAQNEGIRLAEKLEATHVLLMDQDSLPAPDMVERLLQALRDKPDAACVGPRFIDDRHDEDTSPFVRMSGILSKRIDSSSDDLVVKVDQLIASGCLIPIDILKKVGWMREEFFIDLVDFEWCFRARKIGYACYGVHNAVMRHSLGNKAIVILGLVFTIHNPIRYYYRYRNAILLFREKWISPQWKIACAVYYSTKLLFGALLSKNRLGNLKMIALGVADGLRGRSGKLSFH